MLPHDFMDWGPFNKLMAKQNRVLIGHNRAATKGTVNKKNSHPFHHGKIYGCHNGTLRNQYLLPDANKFSVDSNNIMHALNILSTSEVWGKIDGAAALVWWDEDDEILSFLRNDERSFHFTYTEDNRTLFWASEAWMLEGVLGRNGIDHVDIFELPENTEFRFSIPLVANTAKCEPIPVPVAREHAPYVKPPVVTYHNRNNNSRSGFTNQRNSNILPAPANESAKDDLGLKQGSDITFTMKTATMTTTGSISCARHVPLEGWLSPHLGFDVTVSIVGHNNLAIKELMLEGKGVFDGRINQIFVYNGKVHRVLIQANSVSKMTNLDDVKEVGLKNLDAIKNKRDTDKAEKDNDNAMFGSAISKRILTEQGDEWLTGLEFDALAPTNCQVCTEVMVWATDAILLDDGEGICSTCSESDGYGNQLLDILLDKQAGIDTPPANLVIVH